jgi:hypothetical protein
MTAVIESTVAIRTYSVATERRNQRPLRSSLGQGRPQPPLVRGRKPHEKREADDFGDEQLPVRHR